jgi:peptide chain release factor 1
MAEAYLIDKLRSVEQTFHELTRRLADPDVAKDPSEFQRLAKGRSSLEDVVNSYEEWKTSQDELVGARQILKESGGDQELQEMASLEVAQLEEKDCRARNSSQDSVAA